jgi:putative tryptophan/tyrosine transport system substrate-binding protein
MRRREFITLLGGAAAWPITARAQQPERMRRIGVLMAFDKGDAEAQSSIAALLQGLQELGWTESRNLNVEYRFGSERPEVLRANALELNALHLDLIVARATPAVTALVKANVTIPIVFTVVIDPVSSGFVKSWARPGGNITGFAQFEPSIAGKWLEVLKEIAPTVTRVAILFNPDTAPLRGSIFLKSLDDAAPSLGLKLVKTPVHDDRGIEEIGVELTREPGGGIIAMPDSFITFHREQILAVAARYRLPAAYPYAYFSKSGGLISYGASTVDLHRRAASYVDRILRGAKPADLPVQQPTKFELVINLKTAKALGLTVPPSLLDRADEVIE